MKPTGSQNPRQDRRRHWSSGSPAAPAPLYLITLLAMAGILALANAIASGNFVLWGLIGMVFVAAAAIVYRQATGRFAEHHW